MLICPILSHFHLLAGRPTGDLCELQGDPGGAVPARPDLLPAAHVHPGGEEPLGRRRGIRGAQGRRAERRRGRQSGRVQLEVIAT